MKIVIFLCLFFGHLMWVSGRAPLEGHRSKRSAVSPERLRNLSPEQRPSCQPGAEVPPTRVNTTSRLALLRQHFDTEQIDAYIIPSEDAHQSEYPSDYDLRRLYISGMSGSSGRAIVLRDAAALWTDGRYFLQAEDELDCNWILMKSGEEGVPSETEWLIAKLSNGGTSGANPYLISSSNWVSMQSVLDRENITMKEIVPDLIDRDWTTATGRPVQPNTPINALPLQFAGKTWHDKLRETQQAIAEREVDAMIVTGLDETAWIFNLRASDIQYNPFFLSYVILERNSNNPMLFIKDHETKLTQAPSDEETTSNLMSHLNTSSTGTCSSPGDLCVQVMEYNTSIFENQVETVVSRSNRVWISGRANYAIYVKIPQDKILQENTPIAIAKAQKNQQERVGMKNSHRRDAVALISFMAKLEKEVKAGKMWTEVSAANDLRKYREAQLYNRGLSFGSISGSGSNGAIIHYSPSNITDKQITAQEMYLLDSGGQYLDGTTDVTRTFHFGTPTTYEKECYTRVFMGHCDLARLTWPYGLYGREVDTIARRPLWEAGLIYRHGTGHGIGMFLSVHEGPGRIGLSHSSYRFDEPLKEHQMFSDEPGYYEDGKFGIRLENIVVINKVTPEHNFPNVTFLGFETITLVPYEPNLLNYDLLNDKQIEWLNQYNTKVRDEIGPLLKNENEEAYQWMDVRTKPIVRNRQAASSANNLGSSKVLHLLLVFVFSLQYTDYRRYALF